jgi:hypothetical protein
MRVKEQQQIEQEEDYADELSFREWLHYYMNKPTDEELNTPHKQATTKNCLPLRPKNNTSYSNTPLKGA